MTSIRARLGAILAGFLLLGAGSVTATFATIRAQRADALVINLAGRQRMLNQAMTKAVLGLAQDPASNYRGELREASDQFDATLRALLDGGTVVYGSENVTLPPTKDQAIRAQLNRVDEVWGELRGELQAVEAGEPGTPVSVEAIGDVEALSPVLLEEMDRAVRLYEAAAEKKVARLRAIQTLFFGTAVALLVFGYLVIQRTIVDPITSLEAASRRIAGGDLETPIDLETARESEIGSLARSFERMRQELRASRLALERWTEELESRVDHRTRELVALFEISAEITSQLDIQRILASIVDRARELAEGEVSALCLFGQSGGTLSATVTSGPASAFAAGLDEAASHLEVIRPGDAAAQHEACDCTLLKHRFRRSHTAIPLRAGGRVLGVLCVGHRDEGRFGEEERRLLALLANAGAIALENARLYQQLEQEATLAERERIVAEIHDGLAQTLSFLNLRLGAVEALLEDDEIARVSEQVTLIRRTVERTGREVRRLMTDLQTEVSVSRTLEGQLRRVVEDFREEWGMAVRLDVEAGPPLGESPGVCEQVTRVVQEALTNVRKHARAARTVVTLKRGEGEAVVRVQDDGPGFDVGVATERDGHFGLKVMAARAERIGGALSVESALGQGTSVTLRWPVAGGRGGGQRQWEG